MDQRGWVIAIVVSVFFLILIQFNAYFMLFVKFFVNFFASGRSDFKIIGFFVYFILCSLLIIFSTKKKWTFYQKISFKKLVQIFLVLLSISFLVGVGSHVWFTSNYGLDFTGNFKTFMDGQQSSTQLYHIHSTKGVLTKTIDLISPLSQTRYDAGKFFATYLPSFFWVSLLLLTPLLLVFALLLLLHLRDRLSESVQKFKGVSFSDLYVLVYIVASFSVIKNTLDGGIFSYECVFWLSVLLGLFFKISSFKSYLMRLFKFGVIGFYLLAFAFVFFKDGFVFLGIEFFLLSFFLASLILVYYFFARKKPFFVLATFLFFISFVVLIGLVYPYSHVDFTLDLTSSLVLDIPSGSIAHIFIEEGASTEICENIRYSQRDVTICSFTVGRNLQMGELLNENTNLYANYYPIIVEGLMCDVGAVSFTKEKFILVDGSVPSSIHTSIMDITFSEVESPNGQFLYQYEARSHGCIPNFRDVLQKVISDHGVKAYIIEK